MRKKLVCGIVTLIFLVFLEVNVSSSGNILTPHFQTQRRTSEVIEVGSFFLENTSSQKTLLSILSTYRIGATWNLTIHVHPNSTSGVLLTPINGWGSAEIFYHYWTGEEFQVNPNESRSGNCVLHGVTDIIPSMIWKYRLVESEKNASGTYQVQQTHLGYYIDIGMTMPNFGSTYISNITAWLEEMSSTSITSSSSDSLTTLDSTTNPSLSFPIPGFGGWITILGTLCITLVGIFRKTKKKRNPKKGVRS